MKASDLKPGQLIDPAKLVALITEQIVKYDGNRQHFISEQFVDGVIIGLQYIKEVAEKHLGLVNVHGWDEPQSEPQLWLVELEPNVWLASGEGDPPRTLDRRHALEFCAYDGAQLALRKARKYRPFVNAIIWDKSKADDNPTIVDEPAPLQLRDEPKCEGCPIPCGQECIQPTQAQSMGDFLQAQLYATMAAMASEKTVAKITFLTGKAMHRPCAIRELLDAAIAKERKKWKEEYGRE